MSRRRSVSITAPNPTRPSPRSCVRATFSLTSRVGAAWRLCSTPTRLATSRESRAVGGSTPASLWRPRPPALRCVLSRTSSEARPYPPTSPARAGLFSPDSLKLRSTPPPGGAGARLADLAGQVDLAWFDYWPSDYAGHRNDAQASAQLLGSVDGVLGGLADAYHGRPDLIVITSHHGNPPHPS